MIQICINPARVEKVLFLANSEVEEDFNLAAWQAIRRDVDRIDRRIKRIVKDVLKSKISMGRVHER